MLTVARFRGFDGRHAVTLLKRLGIRLSPEYGRLPEHSSDTLKAPSNLSGHDDIAEIG